jgi:hypothetical protein
VADRYASPQAAQRQSGRKQRLPLRRELPPLRNSPRV